MDVVTVIQRQQELVLSEYSEIYDLVIPEEVERGPKKVDNGILEDELEYCERLISVIEKNEVVSQYPKVREKLNLLKEIVADDIEQLELAADPDARVGHKTADTSSFGYKTHLAMTEERVITAAVVTTGEKHDGKQMQELVEKSRKAGIKVEEVYF